MPLSQIDFSSIDAIRSLARSMETKIEFEEDTSILKHPLEADVLTFPNRIALQPMEAADSDRNGTPTHRTLERYLDYAKGGAGVIWFEACSINYPKARTHDAMLVINKDNESKFAKIVEKVKTESSEALRKLGLNGRSQLILQLSHAGRYRLEKSESSPVMAYRFHDFNNKIDVPENIGKVIQDEELKDLKEAYIKAAMLAFEAGFDAVDIKACHGYLLNEFLASFTRKGEYGGESFEKRSRFFIEIVKDVIEETEGIVTSRISAYDGLPYPYGFGTVREHEKDKTDARLPPFDPSEPVILLKKMEKLGISFVNISIGNPYKHPFLTRPWDQQMSFEDITEHPIQSTDRHFNIVSTLKKKVPNMLFIGSGYSWLRQFSTYAAAYNIESNRTDVSGWGRQALAFPKFPEYTFKNGSYPASKACLTCSGCSKLLRAGKHVKCIMQGNNYEK